MANDTGSSSGRVSDKGPITRSTKETLSKKVVVSTSTTPNRKSERLGKRTPPSLAVSTNSENPKKKTTTMTTPGPLRRSERTNNSSSSPSSDPSASKSKCSSSKTQQKEHNTSKQLAFEASDASEEKECDVEISSKLRVKKLDARVYRAVFRKLKKGCHEESNRINKSTREGDEVGGAKIDECFKGNCLDYAKDDKDILPPEDEKGKEMSADSKLSEPVKELVKNNVTIGSLVPSNSNAVPHETSREPGEAKEMKAEPKLGGPVKESLENNVIASSLIPSNVVPHETSGAPERFQSASCREEASQILGSRDSILNENLIRKCAEDDKGEKSISSKRKRTMVDMHSDASAMLVENENDNLIEDTYPSRICSNVAGTSESCSKRIRQISLSDVQRDRGKLIDNVGRHSPKSIGEKLSTRNNEGKSGGPVDSERPQGNNVETEKIRKQQRSLHLLLKPKIAKLCEILHLPDNVKSMVENCLEYTMNNYQICTEPVSILEAFQLSLCWTSAFLLEHKLDFEASLALAKQHLNFDCKKEVVDEINSRLWDLRENFLLLTGNSNVTSSPNASESSNGVYSYTEVTPEAELTKKDISKNSKNIQKHKNQWDNLLLMQQEEKQKLKKDFENESANFVRRCRVEWASIRCCSPSDATRKQKLNNFSSEYVKRIGELERQHEIRLKDLEAKQLEARRKFQESSATDELLNMVAPTEHGASVKSLHTPNQAHHHNAPKAFVSDHVAEGKSFDDIVEVETRTGTELELSEAPDTNSSVVVPCSSPVRQQTPLVKHGGANEMDIVASKDESVSRNKCNNITENVYDRQGNIICKHSNSREQCSDGAISMVDQGQGCVKLSCESHNDCGKDCITSVLLSSNEENCDGETSHVPSGEVALAVCKTSCSNDNHVGVPSSRQGELEGTILSKPVCGLSIEDDSNDGAKNTAPLNSQSSEEHIPSVNTLYIPNCDNTAQIREADNHNGSNNTEPLNLPLSDARVSSWNSKSPQELPQNLNVLCIQNCENSTQIHEDDNSNDLNNDVILNSPRIDERIADGTIVLNRDVHLGMPGTVNFTPSTQQISGGAVDASVLDCVLSRPCGAASPSKNSDANTTILLNQPALDKQNSDGVPSSIPAGKIPVEMSETSHERATVNVLNGGEAMGMPSIVNCTDYPENVTPLNSSINQISDGGLVLDGVLSSGHCTTSPTNDRLAIISLLNPPLQKQTPDRVLSTIHVEQIPVSVSENNHEEADCQLTDSMVVDKNSTAYEQEGVCRTMTENSLSQETPVSRPHDLMERLEQVQPSSSVESPPDQDTQEMQNTLLCSPVDILPANQSIHVSPVMEHSEQEGQLPCTGFPSSNPDLANLPVVTGTEDQLSNEDDLSSFIPETSIEIQNPAVVQCASNLEHDSSHQPMDPASNMDVDSLMPGEVRSHSSDIRTWSTPTEINNQLIQTATQSAPRIVLHLCHDPLKNELERLRGLTEDHMSNYENLKLQLKCEFEKEFEELCKKFETKRKEIEVEFQKTRKNLDTQLNIVLVNKLLAEAFRAKCMDLKGSGTSGMQQDASFAQQLFLPSSQQNATRPSVVASPSSCGPAAANFPSSYATTSSQSMVPPIQVTYNTPGIFSSVSARPPHINSISLPSGNLQGSGAIRTPAPHIPPYRPSTSVPVSSLCTVPHGRPGQPAAVNIPVTAPHGRPSQPAPVNIPSAAFSPRPPQPRAATFQSDPHRVHRPVSTGGLPIPNLSAKDFLADANSQPGINLPSTGGLPIPNLSAKDFLADANSQPGINLPNVLPRMSDLVSLNLSKFGTSSSIPANSAHQVTSPDVVCLSDDD